MPRLRALPTALAVSALAICDVRAQEHRDSRAIPALAGPVLIGSPREDRLRDSLILGAVPTTGALIRSPSASLARLGDTSRVLRWTWVRPYSEVTWNYTIPFSLNDGAQWAGRGLTAAVGGGVQGALGPLSLTFVPQLWRTENKPFPILSSNNPTRSGFASPRHTTFHSADLPTRFGYNPTMVFDLGESALWLTRSGMSLGVSTESQWWGPGIRNALVMSNNAGGIPHVFVRTAAPLSTRFGEIEGKWIIGGLSESRFFDADPANDLRSLSGAIVTFAPAAERNVTAGISRVVYAPVRGIGALPARALDALVRWGEGGNVRSAKNGRAAEQLLSLFGRWRMLNSAAEVYGEWGRILLPVSLREILLAPQFTQGFTAGVQWLPAISERTRLRLQLEFTNLEQSPRSRVEDTLSYYASPVVPQGYTHRGQIVGAAIGPGGSSQWLAADVLRAHRRLGAYVGRIRWDTDAYYAQATSRAYYSYDVSIFTGVRAATHVKDTDISAELQYQHRHNFLFQNSQYGYSRDDAFDKRNVTLRLRIY